jgi:hypothetical protein
MTDLPTGPISPQARQGTVDRLCAHFAADHLETAEFERRLDRAYTALTGAELIALEQDLPELSPDRETSRFVPAPLPATRVDTTRPARDRDFMFAILAGTERKGNWTPPRRLTAFTILGEAKLDFRDATFATPEVNVTLCTILSETKIIVPPGVHVESNGSAILGEFGRGTGRPARPDAPTIRINGVVTLGEVTIEERLPGESGKEARRRLKAARKAKRRGRLSSGIED